MAEPAEPIRAFAAVELDGPIRDAVAALVNRLRARPFRVAWVRPENLHLTLRFLGQIDSERVEAYAALVRDEAARLTPFVARVRGIGVFPDARRPSVVWTALGSETNTLQEIYEIVERAARSIGLAPEYRAFAPHVTLGRVRRESPAIDLAPILEVEKDFDAGAFTVEAVSLFSSELTPQGARYTRLHRLNLDGLRGARDL
jgi:2'-5' RNA ligase